jgi:DNA mismatch endonuclease (patch repair protein)
MVDVFSKRKRSEVMAACRGRGNRSTEWRLRSRLVSARISGWRMHTGDVYGRPDFAFDKSKVAVFVDGCFWHGCKTCRTVPASNRGFWTDKIQRNRQRDRKVAGMLRRSGWRVVRIWEHDLKHRPDWCLNVIRRAHRCGDSRRRPGKNVTSKRKVSKSTSQHGGRENGLFRGSVSHKEAGPGP